MSFSSFFIRDGSCMGRSQAEPSGNLKRIILITTGVFAAVIAILSPLEKSIKYISAIW